MRPGEKSGQLGADGRHMTGKGVAPGNNSPGCDQLTSSSAARACPSRSDNNGPDARKGRALALMVVGTPIVHVADAVKVHRSTIHRWLADPDFQRELASRREEFLERTFDLQAYAGTLATTKLIELLDSQDDKVALRAAHALVAAGRTYVLIDQERRVRRLEDNLPLLVGGAY